MPRSTPTPSFRRARPAGPSSSAFRSVFGRTIRPALVRFRPDFLMISAGFDAHRSDPLAQLMLEEADYVWVTDRLMGVAARHAEGRIVSSLEGGYDLAALAASSAAHVATLMRGGGEPLAASRRRA